MTLVIETPSTHASERDYILDVILAEFLGLPWQRAPSADGGVHLRLRGTVGEIHLPDVFFAQPDDAWLTPTTLPPLFLATWDARELVADIPLTNPIVPVIAGAADPILGQSDRVIELPIDIFGSAYFMLSRYEEAVLGERDEHDRFPATASLAYRAGFLDRPIVDEYVEILWAAMKRLWPSLERKRHEPRVMVSCDVDSPFAFTGGLKTASRRLAGDLIKCRSPRLSGRNLLSLWRARRGDDTADPHRAAIDWIMDVNERAGRAVAFYFISENTHPKLDNRASLDEPRMRALLRTIHTRGHEIGLHPGYNTYKHPEAMARSVATLRRVLEEEDIDQPILGGRQHYLRWETPTTARLWDDNGLAYDSTLSFADRPGFRCGTGREYPLYDLIARRPLKVRERPLIVMECSVIAKRYLGLGYSDEALALMQGYRESCHRLGGDFTLLWHNSHLEHPRDREFYEALTQ